MTNIIQTGFSAGELSPRLFGRTDFAKYQLGAARMRNMFPDVRGAAQTRPGMQFIGAVDDSSKKHRLVPFTFSTLQTYMLVFGDLTMQVVTNGGFVTSGGPRYTLSTPWPHTVLRDLRFTQSADVMTICHPDYQPYDLTRTSSSTWTLTAIDFASQVTAPTIASVTAKVGAAATTYRYQVTAQVGSEESLPSTAVAITTAATMSTTAGEFITIAWNAIPKATLYNVYRQAEIPGGAPDVGSLYGLVGSVTGLTYQDRNGVPDFASGPPVWQNPFKGGGITAVTITGGGAGYSANVLVTATDATGKGFRGFATVAAGAITGVVVQQTGWGYTSPTFVFTDLSGAGAGASGNGTVAPAGTDGATAGVGSAGEATGGSDAAGGGGE